MSPYLKDPFFWFAVISAAVNIGLFKINKKTFALLYKKPEILIDKILLKEGTNIPRDCHISLEVLNQSPTKNMIIHAKILTFPFLSTLEDVKANIIIPPCDRAQMLLTLNEETTSTQTGKLILIRLTDIRGEKTSKLLKLKEINN